MWFVVLFGLWLALRRRQEVFVLWACAGLAVLGADECLKQAAFGVFRVGDLLIFVPFVVWTAFVLFVRYHTKSSMSQAKRTMSSNAHQTRMCAGVAVNADRSCIQHDDDKWILFTERQRANS